MARITFDIPDADFPRVIAAISQEGKYQDKIKTLTLVDGKPQDSVIDNPETRAQFTKRFILEFIQRVVKKYETKLAIEQTRATEEVKPNIGVT